MEKESFIDLVIKFRWLILYGLFGIGTLVTNTYSYAFCTRYFNMPTVHSNVVAWFLALVFAYITNRTWVFESNKSGFREVLKEIVSFTSCRVMTGIVDVFLMVVLVDGLHMYDMKAKLITNFVVIVINLLACKKIIFKEDEAMEEIELADKYVN